MHILLVNLCEQAYDMCLMRTQFFRWSDQHIALPTVMVRRVVMTYRRHCPWRRWRPSWPPKLKCCAKSCRRSSRCPNRCNRDLQWEQIMMDRRWSPSTPSLSGWSPQLSLKQKSPLMLTHRLGPLRPNSIHLSYLALRSARLALRPCSFVEKL
jgi:hypothetical protein